MQLSNFLSVERKPELPITLSIDSGELKLVAWLRTLPGKRYVAKAVWLSQGVEKTVLAKLYMGGRACTSMKAELSGSEKVRAAGLATPGVVSSGSGEGVAWLLFDWLDDASTLAQRLGLQVDFCKSAGEIPSDVLTVVQLMRSMHEQGLLQADLHPDNFILSQQQWHIIDAAEIEVCQSAEDRERNLAMFMAQLPHAWWPQIVSGYGGLNGERVYRYARCHRLWRARDLAAKSLRDCTLFSFQKSFNRWTSVWRDERSNIMPLLDSIEEAMSAGTLLKDGGSSTVVLIEWHGQPLVIKRYNVKGLGHFLRRCLRPSRACHSWQQGHIWRVLELPTAKPVAVLEKRWGPLRLGGYLVTEYSSDKDIIDAFSAGDSEELIVKLGALLERMADYRLSHGDLKGTNVMVSNKQLSFIDLDAARLHSKLPHWKKAFSKDLGRLQRNWPLESSCYKRVKDVVTSLKSRQFN